MKKAYELGILCGADVAVIVFSGNGKLYESAHAFDGEARRADGQADSRAATSTRRCSGTPRCVAAHTSDAVPLNPRHSTTALRTSIAARPTTTAQSQRADQLPERATRRR